MFLHQNFGLKLHLVINLHLTLHTCIYNFNSRTSLDLTKNVFLSNILEKVVINIYNMDTLETDEQKIGRRDCYEYKNNK